MAESTVCWAQLGMRAWSPCLVVADKYLMFLRPEQRPNRITGQEVLVRFFGDGCLAFIEPSTLVDFDASFFRFIPKEDEEKKRVERAWNAALQYLGIEEESDRELNESEEIFLQCQRNAKRLDSKMREIWKRLNIRSHEQEFGQLSEEEDSEMSNSVEENLSPTKTDGDNKEEENFQLGSPLEHEDGEDEYIPTPLVSEEDEEDSKPALRRSNRKKTELVDSNEEGVSTPFFSAAYDKSPNRVLRSNSRKNRKRLRYEEEYISTPVESEVEDNDSKPKLRKSSRRSGRKSEPEEKEIVLTPVVSKAERDDSKRALRRSARKIGNRRGTKLVDDSHLSKMGSERSSRTLRRSNRKKPNKLNGNAVVENGDHSILSNRGDEEQKRLARRSGRLNRIRVNNEEDEEIMSLSDSEADDDEANLISRRTERLNSRRIFDDDDDDDDDEETMVRRSNRIKRQRGSDEEQEFTKRSVPKAEGISLNRTLRRSNRIYPREENLEAEENDGDEIMTPPVSDIEDEGPNDSARIIRRNKRRRLNDEVESSTQEVSDAKTEESERTKRRNNRTIRKEMGGLDYNDEGMVTPSRSKSESKESERSLRRSNRTNQKQMNIDEDGMASPTISKSESKESKRTVRKRSRANVRQLSGDGNGMMTPSRSISKDKESGRTLRRSTRKIQNRFTIQETVTLRVPNLDNQESRQRMVDEMLKKALSGSKSKDQESVRTLRRSNRCNRNTTIVNGEEEGRATSSIWLKKEIEEVERTLRRSNRNGRKQVNDHENDGLMSPSGSTGEESERAKRLKIRSNRKIMSEKKERMATPPLSRAEDKESERTLRRSNRIIERSNENTTAIAIGSTRRRISAFIEEEDYISEAEYMELLESRPTLRRSARIHSQE